MKSVSGKRFAKILEKHSWNLVRVVGSHHLYMKEGVTKRISIPIHGNKDLKRGLLNYFMKIANLREEDI